MHLPRYPGARYPTIERLGSNLGTLPIHVGCGEMREFVVSAIYDQRVVLEIRNHQGGHRYLSLSYEQVEYPLYSIASRAIASHEAQRLYPDDPRGRADRQARIEAQRRLYVDDHWRDVYPAVMDEMAEWRLRNSTPQSSSG
jgi:hypothetical protein